jgi:hypothetical protein
VTVSVNGKTSDTDLTIQDLPALDDIESGAIFRAFLTRQRDEMVSSRAHLVAAAQSTGSGINTELARIDGRISSINAMIDELDMFHQVSIPINSDRVVVLQGDDLRCLERWLYATIMGLYDELTARGMPAGLIAAAGARKAGIDFDASYNAVISGIRNGLEWGNTYFEGIAIGVAVAVTIGGGPVAGLFIAPAALAVAYVHAVYDVGSAAAFNRMIEGARNSAVAAYDLGEKLLSHGFDIASTWCAEIPNWAGELWSDVSDFLSAYDTAEKLAEEKCVQAHDSAPLQALQSSAVVKAAALEDFCAAFDPSTPPVQGRVYASASIPGAEIWFTGAEVYAHLFHLQNDLEDTYYPQIVASSLPRGYTNPNGGMPIEDEIIIAFSPDLLCSQDYPLEGDLEASGVTVTLRTNRDPQFSGWPIPYSYRTVNGTLNLQRFVAEVDGRLKGTFEGELLSEYTICDSNGCRTEQRWGNIHGSFDVVIED